MKDEQNYMEGMAGGASHGGKVYGRHKPIERRAGDSAALPGRGVSVRFFGKRMNLIQVFAMALLACCLAIPASAAEDLQTTLQKGLFEEEANHNLEAAIQAYQSVLKKTDEQRKFAATAIFRLGECYRKLGRTNEAATYYGRIVREYSDQAILANLSKQNLSGLGVAGATSEKATETTQNLLPGEQAEINRLTVLLKNSPDLINAKDSQDLESTPLHQAARRSHLEVARFLLSRKADVNSRNKVGATPLHLAANAGHKSMVELLLSNGADANAHEYNRQSTPLHSAVENDYRAVVEVLLDRGADVNLQDNRGNTPLHIAAQKPGSEFVELLLSREAKVDARNRQEETPLHIAAERGSFESCKLLLAHKADVNATKADGWTPLHHAVRRNLKIVDLLLTNGAHVNAVTPQGHTPLRWLVMSTPSDHFGIIKLLLSKGADPNFVPNGGGYAPIHYAVRDGTLEILTAMLQAKGNPNLAANGDDMKGLTPLHVAVIYQKRPQVEQLLRSGASPNAQISSSYVERGQNSVYVAEQPGVAALHLAVLKTNRELAMVLLENKADPNLQNEFGNTALHLAVRGSDEIVADLLNHGVNTELQNARGVTPLLFAVEMGKNEAAELLIQHKANVNVRSKDGITPLHIAAERQNKTILKLLLEAKADPNIPNAEGLTSLDYLKDNSASRLPGQPVPIPSRTLRRIDPPGFSSQSPDPKVMREEMMEMLRKNGALDWVPRPGEITITRRSANQAAPLFKENENYNYYTLFEVLATIYADPNSKTWEFPDFSKVTIIRRDQPSGRIIEIPIDLSTVATGDCSRDTRLQWGDLVDIPERDHRFGEIWTGLDPAFAEALSKCLERKITIKVQDKVHSLALAPRPKARKIGPDGKPAEMIIERFDYFLTPVLHNSGLLKKTSDLSRILVRRTDPTTGEKRMMEFSLRPGSPSLWVRDGDEIEVLDK